MNRNRTFSIPGLVFTILAAVLPWSIVFFAPMLPVIVLCAACTLLAVLSLVFDITAAVKRNRAMNEQIADYLEAIGAPAEEAIELPEDGLQKLGAEAAAQANARIEEERTTAQFLSDWSKKVMLSLAELDRSTGKLAKEKEEYYLLRQENNTLRCLTEQLMRFFKCEDDCTMYRIQSVDMMRMMSDAILRRASELKNRKIGLRRTTQRLKVQSDPVLLADMLDQLLDNAIRHTPDNGLIALTCKEVNGAAEVTIEDAGCGIPPDELMHVFNRGFTGRSEAPGHAGLGLFTVRSYCHLLGHTIQLRSEVNKGTQAVLRLQLTPPPKPEKEEAASPAEQTVVAAAPEQTEQSTT